MSEQSPWGSPPPSSPSGPSPYQSGGTPPQPPYQPPSGGGYGAPPSYGGPSGPGGPQQPRRNTGLIVGIVAAALVVIAAFVVTLVVTTGDDDPNEAATDNPSSEPTSETTSESSSPSSPSTAVSSDPPAEPGKGTIIGDGYQYDLPAAGWTDASDGAEELGGTIDTIIVLGSSIQTAQSNILVEALSAGPATELEELEQLWKRNLSSTDNATPVDIEDTTIDGERAIGVSIDDRKNLNGDLIKQVAYLTLHEGNQYSIGLSFPAQDDVVSQPDFQKVLDSWTWVD